MNLPVFCFYVLKHNAFQIPQEVGIQEIETKIDRACFRDFAENMSYEQVENLPENEKPALIIINNFDEFKSSLMNRLTSNIGLSAKDVLFNYISYYNFTKLGKTNWIDLGESQPYELFYKDKSFEYHSEARIVINTDNDQVKKHLIEKPIDIGELSDIAEYKSEYFSDGIKIVALADIQKKY